MGLARKRPREDNEEGKQHAPHSKRNKKNQDFQDSCVVESSSCGNAWSHSGVSNNNAESMSENSLSKIVPEFNYNASEISQEEDVVLEGEGPYSHINQILKEAHFYSLQQRRQSLM